MIRILILERFYLGKIEQIVSSQPSSPVDPNKKRVIFNTQYATTFTWIEYLLANKLKRRGHQVDFLICDGLPYCEQETITTKRPSCDACHSRVKNQIEAFGFKPKKLGDYLTGDLRKEAKNFAASQPIDVLRNFQLNGVHLGDIAYRNLAHYLKGIFPIEGEYETVYRRIFESGYLTLKATIGFFEGKSSSTVVSTNGKFIQSGIGVDLGKELGYDYVTWEVFNQFTSTVFARNSIAAELRIDEAWEVEKEKALTEKEKMRLYKNFKDQASSSNTPFQYQEAFYVDSHAMIREKYQLDANRPIIVMFTNVEWDSTAMIDSGFSSMLHWIQDAIDYCAIHTDYQLIVRAHPGELKVPDDLKTRYPICDRIYAANPVLPSNVRLLGPLEEVNSYALGEVADVVMVYSSTMGIEFALRGMKPWVAARTYYAGKGFTNDLLSKEDMYLKLNSKIFKQRLTNLELNYAERFAYIIRYRYLFSIPFIANGRFSHKRFQACLLGQEGIEELEKICDLIDGKRHNIDLGQAQW